MKRRHLGFLTIAVPLAACQQNEQPATGTAPVAVPIAGGTGGGHWLIGRWRGQLIGMRSGDPGRTLIVSSVDATGRRATGQWAGANVDIQISGTTIRFFTAANNPVELTYQQPSTLEGEVTNAQGGGRQGGVRWSITMQRA
jgi:hypothetical protein